MSEIIQKPKILIDDLIKEKLKTEIQEESQVIIHLFVPGSQNVRIWKTTYLFSKSSTHRSQLIHFENISLYPQWMFIPASGLNFTLIFSGLPKSCKSFDLIEIIPEPGGFHFYNIQRNQSDVYFLDLS